MAKKFSRQIVVSGNLDLNVARFLMLHRLYNILNDESLDDCEIAEEMRLAFANQIELLTPEPEEVSYLDRYL